jgi:hypothetical protein
VGVSPRHFPETSRKEYPTSGGRVVENSLKLEEKRDISKKIQKTSKFLLRKW